MKSGVYQINCKNSKEFYIGSAKDLNHRWNTHLYCLKNNKHHNIILQRKFNKYGEENFKKITSDPPYPFSVSRTEHKNFHNNHPPRIFQAPELKLPYRPAWTTPPPGHCTGPVKIQTMARNKNFFRIYCMIGRGITTRTSYPRSSPPQIRAWVLPSSRCREMMEWR